MYNWAKDLKVGDKVIVVSHRHSRYISKVARLTKTLIITEDEKRFSKKWLNTPGDSWFSNSLMKWTQELEYSIQLKKKKEDLIVLIHLNCNKIKFSKLTIEELKKLLSDLKQLNDQAE